MSNAALFECLSCDGQHLPNGRRASPFQIHRGTSKAPGMVVCDGCACVRPILREGESIPIEVSRWPNLPGGLR